MTWYENKNQSYLSAYQIALGSLQLLEYNQNNSLFFFNKTNGDVINPKGTLKLPLNIAKR